MPKHLNLFKFSLSVIDCLLGSSNVRLTCVTVPSSSPTFPSFYLINGTKLHIFTREAATNRRLPSLEYHY